MPPPGARHWFRRSGLPRPRPPAGAAPLTLAWSGGGPPWGASAHTPGSCSCARMRSCCPCCTSPCCTTCTGRSPPWCGAPGILPCRSSAAQPHPPTRVPSASLPPCVPPCAGTPPAMGGLSWAAGCGDLAALRRWCPYGPGPGSPPRTGRLTAPGGASRRPSVVCDPPTRSSASTPCACGSQPPPGLRC